MASDYNEFRVVEVLVDEQGMATALRVEATWGTTLAGSEPLIWDRTVFTAAAVGSLAEADVGDRLELRPVGDRAERGRARRQAGW